jgi:hypothetical protein
LNDITPISLSGAKVAFALTKSKTLAQRVGSVAAWLAIDSTNDDWLVASYDPPWDAGNATLKAVELAGNWSDIFDRDDAYVPRIIIKSNGTRIWDGVTLTPSRFDSIEDGRGCDFSRSGAARYFCETCPAGRFQVKAAQKASCVDCVFPSIVARLAAGSESARGGRRRRGTRVAARLGARDRPLPPVSHRFLCPREPRDASRGRVV